MALPIICGLLLCLVDLRSDEIPAVGEESVSVEDELILVDKSALGSEAFLFLLSHNTVVGVAHLSYQHVQEDNRKEEGGEEVEDPQYPGVLIQTVIPTCVEVAKSACIRRQKLISKIPISWWRADLLDDVKAISKGDVHKYENQGKHSHVSHDIEDHGDEDGS